MRILLIAQFGSSGGTREAFKRILNVHHSKGYKTHVLIDHNSDEAIKNFITGKGATFSEAEKRGERNRGVLSSFWYEHRTYSSALRKWNPELVVASIGTPHFAHYLFLRRYPLVFVLHTIPKEAGEKLKKFYRTIHRAAGKNQYVCGVSHATVQSVIKNWGFAEERVALIHNSFSKEYINAGPGKDDSSQLTVLTLGHVVSYKNPALWLKVARQITQAYDHVEFVWLGDGELLEEFQKRTKNESRIGFLGYMENVKEFYSKASIYFQPSTAENHSFSVLDAMANRLPCVVSDVGGQPDSIRDGFNGYLCKHDDVKGFTGRISKLIENPELRRKMGEQSGILVNQKFHPDHYEAKLTALYHKTLDNS